MFFNQFFFIKDDINNMYYYYYYYYYSYYYYCCCCCCCCCCCWYYYHHHHNLELHWKCFFHISVRYFYSDSCYYLNVSRRCAFHWWLLHSWDGWLVTHRVRLWSLFLVLVTHAMSLLLVTGWCYYCYYIIVIVIIIVIILSYYQMILNYIKII